MGRLDDAAKHKVVELRKAGLSFRKIKAVLELENIKVSAQAIYLFLREFQGRPPGRVRPAEAGSSSSPVQMQPRTGPMQESWSSVHLQNLLRDSSHHAGFTAADFPKQTSTTPEAAANSSGPAENLGGSRSEQQHEGNKEENDIQIVSVTSLAQQRPQTSRPEAGAASMRRRVTPSPATSSMLAARKRLLDKALSHRMKVASLLRRDQSSVQGSDLRSALPETYDLTSDKTVVEAQPGGGSAPRRFLTQRPGLSVRSFHPPPRVGIRLPNRPLAALASSGPGAAVIRLHAPGRSEGNPSPQQVQDGAARGLPDQIQALGSEVRSLSLAVKMLVEQQCRLEREQVQQTQVQKQILSTLQTLASKVGQCSSVQQQQTKTPSPSAAPSFSQDSFSFSQSSYPQSQPAFSPLEALETSEAFKLPGLSPAGMNGFPPCSSAESLPLSHSSPQPQTYYSQQSSLMSYSQPYSTFSQPQTFRAAHSKTSDFSSSFQDCSVSTASLMTSAHPTQDRQVSSIKVEGP
ncbi:uncharacterized protein LOC110952037 isoform X2 [Acanthochromis polyacanthus]|uniref:uncharacterized protein LOC110952037 isoform X2 n=1 Tax=Acanthochromis polyacanthus TaxID=80966 RepID=UPI0022349E43|nr:uncharacterized protein LOC110952037 isoform X2 [Acanthochromis polyacanthus]